ncbi:helix-turn-helix transcriptional regulator [Kordia sp. YSTF-M3]|uniref:Helix-turn-helix transcriptional regulator n=1 Tax=Kordia aestuariivivens TaxID=2759037 RepID=A0ABR7QCC2_9FLAO|nr:AraC family transcriptional regulator [Kordia aestuariivivens]MBC8756222.1 helix-turn-helix transcriptional regulator [Kordia aestuariivivens]
MTTLHIDIWILLFFAFSFQAFTLGILFFLKQKGDKVANKLFGIFLFLFSYNLLYNCAYWATNKGLYHPHLLYTNLIPWVLYGPLLYLYIRRVLYQKKMLLRDSLHAIPLLLIFIKYGDFFILSATEKLQKAIKIMASEDITPCKIYKDYIIIIVMLLMCFYVGLIYKQYHTYKKETSSAQIRLWIMYLLGSYTAYLLIFSLYYLLESFQLMSLAGDYIIGYCIVVIIGIVSYFSFMQPDIFSGKKIIPYIKYQKNGMLTSFALEMKQQLEDLMEIEKVYLDHTLTLDKLADLLNLSKHHTSQIINEYFQSNFFEFVSNYRIKEAITLMLDTSNTMNINEIIDATGFNNRSSFYTAFKKKTGMSPTSYQKKSFEQF